MLLFLTLGCITSVIVGAMGYFILLRYQPAKVVINADYAREILKSPQYNRCKPNKWLINTLSIVNPFTIDSESLLKSFKTEVMKTLAKWSIDEKYEELVLTIRNRIDYRLSTLKSKNSTICLSKLAKQVTLDAFLSGILNIHANDELLTELPDLIIHLWKHRDDKLAHNRLQELLLSNKDKFTQSEFWQHLQVILSNHTNIISQIVTNDFEEKISNPLNIIVPGWETMWRVVFYSLLELLRHEHLLENIRLEINNHSKSYRKCLLLQCLLKETLRLYPPTKNIYRKDLKTGQDIRINIQHIHRDKNIWGFDALEFNPDRFKELTDEQKISYLPFSISCPARNGFAYGFAGAIVAEILQRCSNFSITEEFSTLSNDKLLDTTRDSYKDLLINM